MYSWPEETSTGTICPGSLVANASSPAAPTARYSVMNSVPPPATRFSTPSSPPPPPNWVWVVIWIEPPIHDSSPASEMIDSFGSSQNSRTGIVVPVTWFFIRSSPDFKNSEYTGNDHVGAGQLPSGKLHFTLETIAEAGSDTRDARSTVASAGTQRPFRR